MILKCFLNTIILIYILYIADITSDHYNHLDEVKNKLNSANISDPKDAEERYDHLQSWSKRAVPLASTDSGTEHYKSAESSPLRKCSNASDDVFTSNVAMNKTSPNVYRDLPANYEEPWDSEEGQKRFDRLMNKAEKKHETRKSIDQTNSGVPRKSVDQPGGKVNKAQTPVNNSGCSELYEAAWAGGANQRATPATPQQHRPNAPANYEDAWDLPEKQKEFEEKLLQARKQRTSQGQIREDDTLKTDSGSKPFSGPSPPCKIVIITTYIASIVINSSFPEHYFFKILVILFFANVHPLSLFT